MIKSLFDIYRFTPNWIIRIDGNPRFISLKHFSPRYFSDTWPRQEPVPVQK